MHGRPKSAVRASLFQDAGPGEQGMQHAARQATTSEVATSSAVFEEILAAVDNEGRAARDERTYYRDVLLRLLSDGPYLAIAVWSVEEGRVQCRARAPEAEALPPPDSDVIERAAQRHGSEVIPPGDPQANGSAPPFPVRIIAGYRILESDGVVLEAAVRPGSSDVQARRLLEAVAELVSHFYARQQYRRYQQHAGATDVLSTLLTRFYGSETLVETALLVAEGLQEELGYDRAWVCLPEGRRARILATSAAMEVSRRRSLTKRLERAAGAALRGQREIRWEAGASASNSLPEVVAFADESGARRTTILPLFVEQDKKNPVALVVLEGFTGEPRSDEQERTHLLAPHAGLALWQALRSRRTGWRGVLHRSIESWRWLKYVAIAVGSLLLAGWLLSPTDFEVEVDGRLMPVNRRGVFAPGDGVVTALDVKHNQSIAAGARILQLRDPKLDLDQQRLAGQLEELRSRLASLQVLRAQGRRTTSDTPADLSVQEEQLNVALAGAEQQLVLVRQQQEQLTVASPIAGVVDRWDLAEALTARPVVRGQFLVDVLDVAGEWQLDLQVPDQSIGQVLAASHSSEPLKIRYILRTDPSQQYESRLTELGDRVQLDARGRPMVRGAAALGERPPTNLRAGASVVAHIHCGRTSRAFAWFHELWDYVQRKWLL